MIRLDNVSKFYYNQGVISVGFSKVSLNFNMGEFVAITGESGSGKSTLLNVISGLDTYEEGEMFIYGEETSHYTEKDFEDYRRKYIGNIFQNFNLVNSYTVYQNIELPLLLAGMKRREAKARALELIERVGLSAYKKTKASKLSGGQKQRVAIARALAKDTPIIIADEPTGNLDSESAADIIKLLADISKEKLVVIVTHNFDQVAPYITRKIKMHDGKVLEDIKFNKEDRQIIPDDKYEEPTYENIRPLSEVRLGIRNAFNIPVKFILLTFVFVFAVLSFVYEISIYQSLIYTDNISGYSTFFFNSTDHRLVLKKLDEKIDKNTGDKIYTPVAFSEEDYNKIKEVPNVELVIENDLLNDRNVEIRTENYEYDINALPANISEYNYGDPDFGRLPEKENEVLIVGTDNSFDIQTNKDFINGLFDAKLYLSDFYNWNYDPSHPVKIVGIKFLDVDELIRSTSYTQLAYFGDEYFDYISKMSYDNNSEIYAIFQGEKYGTKNSNLFRVLTSTKVKQGECWASSQINYMVPKTGKALFEKITLESKDIYCSNSIDLKITKIYDKKSFQNAFSIPKNESFDMYDGAILINPNDYNKLINHPSYQSSVFVKDQLKVSDTADALRDMGYDVLVLKDCLYNDGTGALLVLLNKGIIAGMAIVILIISYFVIRIILKSRNVYYSTIRMLGANVSKCRNLLILDLLVDANIAYIITVGAIHLLNLIFPDVAAIKTVITFMDPSEYIAVYVIVIIISIIISLRYSSKLFKKSTMQTLKEEV